jgi:hypothetical protein
MLITDFAEANTTFGIIGREGLDLSRTDSRRKSGDGAWYRNGSDE